MVQSSPGSGEPDVGLWHAGVWCSCVAPQVGLPLGMLVTEKCVSVTECHREYQYLIFMTRFWQGLHCKATLGMYVHWCPSPGNPTAHS